MMSTLTKLYLDGMFEESPQLSTSGSARLLVTIQSNNLSRLFVTSLEGTFMLSSRAVRGSIIFLMKQ